MTSSLSLAHYRPPQNKTNIIHMLTSLVFFVFGRTFYIIIIFLSVGICRSLCHCVPQRAASLSPLEFIFLSLSSAGTLLPILKIYRSAGIRGIQGCIQLQRFPSPNDFRKAKAHHGTSTRLKISIAGLSLSFLSSQLCDSLGSECPLANVV